MEEYGNYDVDADSGYAEGENWTSSDYGFAAYPNLEQEQIMPWEHYQPYEEDEESLDDIVRNSQLSVDAAEFVPKSINSSLVTYQSPTSLATLTPRLSIQNLQIARKSQNIQQTMIQCHRHHHHQHYMPQSLHIHQHYQCNDPTHRMADHSRCHGPMVHPPASLAPHGATCMLAHSAHSAHVPHGAYLAHGTHLPHAITPNAHGIHGTHNLYSSSPDFSLHPQITESSQDLTSITDKHLTPRKACVMPACVTYLCKSSYH